MRPVWEANSRKDALGCRDWKQAEAETLHNMPVADLMFQGLR